MSTVGGLIAAGTLGVGVYLSQRSAVIARYLRRCSEQRGDPAEVHQRLDVRVQVPKLLFFPECRSAAGSAGSYCAERFVRIDRVDLDRAISMVTVRFDNGQSRSFCSDCTIAQKVSEPAHRLEALQFKLTVSYLLDDLCQRSLYLARLQDPQIFNQLSLEDVLSLSELQKDRRLIDLVAWEESRSTFCLKEFPRHTAE